jgi:hypothetical protein
MLRVPSEPSLRERRHRAMNRRATIAASLVLVIGTLAGCSLFATPDSGSHGPSPSPNPSATAGATESEAQLKLGLVDAYGPLWYCDPDFFPIAHGEEIDNAKARWPEVMADAEAFRAIAAKLGLDPAAAFTDAQKLAAYQAWKVLQAIALNPIGNDAYRFDYLAQPKPGGGEGLRTAGTITTSGAITVEQQAASGAPNCPICLPRGTRIETPSGGVAVEALRIGDAVWTLDVQGRLVVASVIALGSTLAPANHHVVRVVLADGRSVTASPGHPLADGRHVGDLRAGDLVDGTVVTSAGLVPYGGARTYDLVVSGPTGSYLVDGIALGSTIR